MVIAVKKDDNVVLGVSICPGCSSMSDKDLSIAENLPFWKVKGEKDCYVCAEDMSYDADLLRYNDYIFRGISDGKSILENVLPKMKDLLSKHNLLLNNKEWENQLLIVKGGKMFKISNYFCLSEVDKQVALGGETYVLGALDVLKEQEPTESILQAYRGFDRMRNRQNFPVTIVNLKTKRHKVYYK